MPAGRGHHELTKRYCRECGKPLKYSSTRKNDVCASCNGGNKKKPTHDELVLMIVGADNNKPVPSLTHIAAIANYYHYLCGNRLPFSQWSIENEVGWLYNKITAGHEHEKDVL